MLRGKTEAAGLGQPGAVSDGLGVSFMKVTEKMEPYFVLRYMVREKSHYEKLEQVAQRCFLTPVTAHFTVLPSQSLQKPKLNFEHEVTVEAL